MAFKLLGLLFSTSVFAASLPLRTTDFQQSLNAFAPRNHVKNSGAERGVADVSGSSIYTRSTTSPLQGAASFSINATTSGQTVFFAVSEIQDGLAGRSCEASFTYSGDASLYKAYTKNNTVAESVETTLLNTGTASQRFSVIVPCGDNDDVHEIVIESTGNGAAIKVDDIYFGQPSVLGSVAQAQVVLSATRITSNQSISGTTPVQVVFNSAPVNTYNEYSTSTGTFTAKRSARLLVSAAYETANVTANTSEVIASTITKNGSTACIGYNTGVSTTAPPSGVFGCVIDVVSGDTVTATIDSSLDSAYDVVALTSTRFSISAFPADSQTVLRGDVTNVAVEASGTPTGSLSAASATIWGTESRDTTGSYNNTTGEFTPPYVGDFCWNAGVVVSGTEAADNSLTLTPYVNGSALTRFAGGSRVWTTAVTSTFVQSNGCTYLTKSDVLTFRTNTNIGSPAFASDSANYLSIRASSQALPQPFIPSSVFTSSSNTNYDESGTTSIQAGTTTPTPIGITNVSAVSSAQCQYKRIGKIVNVSCRVPLTCTTGSSTVTSVDMPLPVTSNLSATGDLNGVIGPNASLGDGGGICIEDTTNDRASCTFACSSTNSLAGRRVMFQYVVK